jgi:hypothetical protein
MSQALAFWESVQQGELDRLDAAHLAMGGAGPGRRTATQQINDAYIVLLAAHFQLFCRGLHNEAIAFLAASAPHMTNVVRDALMQGRLLDRGNASPAALGSDSGRLGLRLWGVVEARDSRNAGRRKRLDQLVVWRNAVAHQDFQFKPHLVVSLAKTRRTLAFVRDCRAACCGLAGHLDAAVCDHLRGVVGGRPW